MGLLSFNPGNFSDALAGLSQGLLAYGSGQPQGLLTVPAIVARSRQDRLQNTRQQQLLDMEQQKFGLEKTKLQQEQDQYAQHQAAMDALKKSHPEWAPYIDAFGGDAASPILKQAFPGEPDAPKTVGGMQFNPQTKAWEAIPGYTEQAAAIAAAGRAPQQPNQPPADVQEYNFAKDQGFTGSYMDWKAANKSNTQMVQTGTDTNGNPVFSFVPVASAKPATEDQAKADQLYTRASQQLKIATDNWDSLADLPDQAKAKIPGIGNFLVSPKYQQASAAVKDIAASYLYSVSGATANPGEVANLVETITPKPGDDAATVQQKKERLSQMVESIKLRKQQQAQPAPVAAEPQAQPVKILKFDSQGNPIP